MEILTGDEFARELGARRARSGKSYRLLSTEIGLGQATISGWCTGRHLPQTTVTDRFVALLDALKVPAAEKDTFLDALVRLRSVRGAAASPDTNPYPGLRAFRVDEADRFFGREELTARLVSAVAAGSVIVVGASGSGKTSLLRAGLVPALASPVVFVSVGAVDALASAADSAVVVVDHLEELFTLHSDEEVRREFLAKVSARSAPVVFGLRADFYDQALRYPFLAGLLRDRQVIVEPMTGAELREVVVRPAAAVELPLEPGLVELLVRDTAGAAAGLPLLSHAVHATVEHFMAEAGTEGRVVRVEHYQGVGGVHGAIARSAALAVQAIPTGSLPLVRQLFLRLVRIDDDAADTRRRIGFDEMFDGRTDEEVDALSTVLDVFVTYRLLTVDADSVEISHEALLSAWPLLSEWLAEDRVGRHVHSRLTAASKRWRASDDADDHLYRNSELAAAEAWATTAGTGTLNRLETEFLAASARSRAAGTEAERRRVQHRNRLITALLALTLVATGTTIYARSVSTAADAQRTAERSRALAATANRLRDKDPTLAGQLALAAYRITPTPEARSALLDAASRPLATRLRAPHGSAGSLAVKGDLLAVGSDTGEVTLTGAGGATVGAVDAEGAVSAMAVSKDGTLLAAAGGSGVVSVWRLQAGGPPVALTRHNAGSARVFALAFSPDGTALAAASGDLAVRLWQVGSGDAPTILTGPREAVKGVAFTPDGARIAAGGDDGTVHVWEMSGNSPPIVLTGPTSKVYSIAVSPDGRSLVAGTSSEHVIYRWNLDNPGQAPDRFTGPESWINVVAFSPDGSRLAAGSSDTRLWQWDLQSGRSLNTLPHPKPVTAIEFKDDRTPVTLATDGIARVWSGTGPVLTGPDAQVYSASFDMAGRRLLIGSGDNTARLWDVSDPLHPSLATPAVNGDPTARLSGASAITPDGNTLILGTTDGSISVQSPGGKPVNLPLATATVQAVVLDRTGRTAAVSSDDGTVHLVDLTEPANPRAGAVLSASTGIAYGTRFSPDGRLLAVGTAGSEGHLWDLTDRAKPRLLTTVSGFHGPVYAAAFNHDGSLAAFAGSDYAVRLVDLTRPASPVALDRPLLGPVGEVYELAFHPNRDELAVSSVDGTIRLWDLTAPSEPVAIGTLDAGDGLLTAAFSADGRRLAAGGRSGTTRMWHIEPEEAASLICTTAGAPITPEEWAQFVPDHPYTPPCG
ncbi:helix-turn-helix domain-containing protein [Lentzea sp. HUAS12]|uniref:nSTAND1 domain-containing NTPase n=1 Tax=Lentzea sp. HUAS12 TaxID=2951806 RepID=UPI00209F32BB|nr:helix-turn-helix domain-containing protein [Lentzea sp. HUAS12]USX54107.1 helix-turn-helix domain-containing protein [Lentzea sp. HUAS12]